MAAAFCGALLCSLLRVLSLAFLDDTPRTVMIAMKLEVHCTSVASAVSFFIGVRKKTWPISHFAIKSIDDLLTLTTLR